jgi:hypothetical protein
MLYLVTYDRKRGTEYEPLYDLIKDKYPGSWRGMQNVWFVPTEEDSASDIVDNLQSEEENTLKLFVTEITGNSSWYAFSESRDGWMLERINFDDEDEDDDEH